jgi:hypothetical protein
MASPQLSSSELEADADRLRAQLGVTIDRLRHQLAPSQLAEEWAESSGLKDMTPSKFLDLAARRHPLPTILAGAGLGFLAYAATRRRHRGNGALDLAPSSQANGSSRGGLKQIAGSLADTATKAFRDRAQAKRDEVVDAAKSHVASAAHQLSDATQKTLDDLLVKASIPAEARPILSTTVQLLLVAGIESVLGKLVRT